MTSTRLAELRAASGDASSEDERILTTSALAGAFTGMDAREALVLARAALERASRAQDRVVYARALHEVGSACYSLSEFKEALDRFQEALSIFTDLGDAKGRMDATSSIGCVYHALGRVPEAEECYRSALAEAEECGDVRLVASCRIGLGKLLTVYDPARATEELSAAAPLVKALGNDIGVVEYQLAMGEILARRGEHDAALQHFSDALGLAEAAGSNRLIATSHYQIGDVLLDLGDYATALGHYEITLDLRNQLGDQSGVGFAYGGIGNVYYLLEDDPLALEYYQKAIDVWSAVGQDDLVALWRLNLGHVLERSGDKEQALLHYRASLAWTEARGLRQHVAVCLGDIGDIHLDRGEFADALAHYSRALAIAEEYRDLPRIAHWTGSIGLIYSLPWYEGYDPKRGEDLLLTAIRRGTESGYRHSLREDHQRLSAFYQREGRWKEAHEQTLRYFAVKEELQSIEALKKAQQIEHRRQIAELEQQRVIDQARAEAEALVQREKARQLERELNTATLQLLAQAELLTELRSDLLRIARRIPPSEPAARELRERVKRLPCDSVDWDKFDRQFREVHPDFVRTLTARAPDLTPTELRICSMVRMNLKSIEIAQIFCTTEKGIEFHRGNIRRKLKLTRDDKLPIVLSAM